MTELSLLTIRKFIISTLENSLLDNETKSAVQHYVDHDEYEMAFEGMFIDLMKFNEPITLDRDYCIAIAIYLKLDQESVFSPNFWTEFQNFLQLQNE